jgi:hypothetical protein
MLEKGNKIKFNTSSGTVGEGIVENVNGSRVTLQSGYVIYQKDVIEVVKR